MRKSFGLLLLPMLASQSFAQSAPPDLRPKLGSEPVIGRQAADKEKPRLQDPPRPPVAGEGGLNAPASTTAPTR